MYSISITASTYLKKCLILIIIIIICVKKIIRNVCKLLLKLQYCLPILQNGHTHTPTPTPAHTHTHTHTQTHTRQTYK